MPRWINGTPNAYIANNAKEYLIDDGRIRFGHHDFNRIIPYLKKSIIFASRIQT